MEKFKAGDPVRCTNERHFCFNDRGVISKEINNVAFVIEFDYGCKAYIDHSIYHLEKLPDEENKMEQNTENRSNSAEDVNKNTELKLEVGEKYNLNNHLPQHFFTYFGDKRQVIKDFDPMGQRYIFLNFEGELREFSAEDIDTIKEYREPYKNSVVGWAAYNDLPPCNHLLDKLLAKSLNGAIFKSKKIALMVGPNTIYGRWTFEELPEPEITEGSADE